MAAPVLQFKRGLLTNLPGLRAGEPALTTDTYELYVGIDSTTSNNKFFGSHRYWTREDTTTGSSVNLVEGSSNGSNYVALKSPDTLAANLTYTLPGTDGSNGQVLSTNGSGALSFIDAGEVTLPSDVQITSSLDVPTVEVTNLKARDGTTSITITDSTGAVATASNLTVGGNLIVNGSTTQVNTSQTTIEDQLLELGMVDGSAPSSDLNKDIGLIFNYYTSSAKKAAVYWDDSSSRVVISDDVSESTGVLTAAAHAALEIGSLWVNDCAGQSQVINCSGSTRTLENITIDAGTF